MSVGTGCLLDGNLTRAQVPAQLVDGFQASEPRGAGKDIDVDGARFRPGMKNGVGLAEDQNRCESCSGKRV